METELEQSNRQCQPQNNLTSADKQCLRQSAEVRHIHTTTTSDIGEQLAASDDEQLSNLSCAETVQYASETSSAAFTTVQHNNLQGELQPTVSVVSVYDGVVTVKSSLSNAKPDPGPDVTYNLAESELVALDTADVDSLVESEIVGEACDDRPDTDTAHTAKHISMSNSRWPHNETLRLIQLYKDYQHYLTNKHFKKKTVWTMIAAKLAKGSKLRKKFTGAQVGTRWKNLTKMYRDCVRDMEQGRSSNGKFRYFDEMSSVYDTNVDTYSEYSHSQCIKKQTRITPSKQSQPATQSFVAIAPRLPAASSYSVFLPEKSACVGSHTEDGHCFLDVVQAVQKLHEDHKRSEEWKLNKLEQMHKEKMQMFAKMLDILKN